MANGPYVGAAYAIAPNARIDDGLLDTIIFHGTSIPRVLLHLALVAGGRPLPPPRHAQVLRVPWIRVRKLRRGRPLPVHIDGNPIGVTPVEVHAAPAALRVLTGPPDASGIRAWEVVGPVGTLSLLESAPAQHSTRVAHPLSNPTFRELWLANIVSNIGTWMQTVGGAWLMTTLTADALPVALMQTATTLPAFLVGLPAGSLADRLDRRRLTLATQAWMLLCAAALGVLTLAGAVTPWLLLGMTFALGFGSALAAPTWAAIIPDVVDRPQVPTAIIMNSAGYNVARATGPALGGLVVAVTGPAYAFLLNAASFLATLGVVFRWRPRAGRAGSAEREPLTHMVVAGLHYVWQAEAQRVVLVRSTLWMLCASAFWGLLPVVAVRELNLDATGYGLLVTCVGIGAVGGAFALPWLRRRVHTNRLLMLSIMIFALMYLVLAWVHVGAAGVRRAGDRWRGVDDVESEFSDRGADERAAQHGRAGDRRVPAHLSGWAGDRRRGVGRAGGPGGRSDHPDAGRAGHQPGAASGPEVGGGGPESEPGPRGTLRLMTEAPAVVVDLVDGMAFRAATPSGHSLVLDSSGNVGGREQGPRPMEMLLVSLGACTGMDVISILRKMHLEVSAYQVRVSGSRASEHPRVYTAIRLEHVVTGRGLKAERVRHAVELSARQYCPAMAMLSRAAPIEVVFRVIDEVSGEAQEGSLTVGA